MAYDGTLKFDTSMDSSGFQKDASKLGDIVKGLAVFKILEKGFQAITASIDQAVSRYDTLNRFPKVMQQMGYSAESADASISKLADGIQGLPTTLDGIVGSTQRLAISLGSLDKGTDTALALNNALIASGASSEAASRGAEQYIQALSRNKMEMQEWKILQETMPYALQKTAEAFGYTGKQAIPQLYDALKNGEITMIQFNDKLIELNDGVGGFADVALTASGGISTAFANMNTRIAAGVTEVIKGIDSGFSQTKFKSIENIISSTGTIIKNILSSVAGAFEFIASRADILVPALIAVGAAVTAWKITAVVADAVRGFQTAALQVSLYAMSVNSAVIADAAQTAALTTKEVVVGLLTGKVTLAAAATRLWNAVLGENTLLFVKETAAQVASTAATVAHKVATVAHTTATQAANGGLAVQAALINAALAAKIKDTAATAAHTVATAAYTVVEKARGIITGVTTGAISLQTVATIAQTVATNAAAVATGVLSAAITLLAGPIGIAIAVIAALVTGIIALVSWLNQESEEYKKQKKELEELTTAHEEYEKRLDEDQAAADQTIAKLRAQTSANVDLVSSLRSLMATNDAAGSNNNAIARTVDQLNKSVEGLNLTYDETTGKLSANIDEVEKYVKAQGQLSVIKAQEEEYNRLLGEQLDLQAKIRVEEEQQKILAQQLEDKTISQREYNDLVKRSNDLIKEYGATEQQLATDVQAAQAAIDYAAKESAAARVNAFEAVNGAIDAEGRNLKQLANFYDMTTDEILAEMEEWGLSMADWSAKKAEMFTKEGQSLQGVANQWGMTTDEVLTYMDEWGMGLDDFSQHMKDTHTKEGLSLDDLAAKWGATSEAIKTEMDNMGLSMQEWSDQQQEAWKDYEAAVKERTQGVINSFKEIPGEYDKSATEMLEILMTNKTRYAEWEAAMEEITRQLGPTAAEEFAKLGPEATSAMQEILASTELLDQYREAFGVKLDEVTGTAVEDWNDPNFIGAPSTAIDTSAQLVTQNTALDTAMTDTMEGAKAAAEAVDFSVVGQNIAADIVGGLNSADVNGAMANITAAIQNNISKVTSAVTSMSTSVQSVLRNMKTQATSIATQTMTEINSAIVARSNTVKSSVTSMGNGVVAALNTMRTQAANVAMQMMTDINSTIVSRTSTVRASATAAANSVVNGLEPMVPGAENVANRMMDGIGTAMDRKAPSLYAKAREIANRIASIMADALDVHSPSRVMIQLFENVMLGIYEGMDGMSGMLYREAESIADGIADRLTISKDVANALVEQIRTITTSTPLGGVALVPQMAAVGAGGGARYITSLTQNITTPKPLSPSEMTREGQDLLRRTRWQLP